MKRTGLFLEIVVAALFLTGCLRRTDVQGVVEIRVEHWITATMLLGSLALLALSLFFKRRLLAMSIVCLLFSALGLGILVPSAVGDFVRLDASGWQARYGFWWSPSLVDVRFADLARIECTTKNRRDGKGHTRTSYYLDCQFQDRRQERLPVGDMMKVAVSGILDRAAAKGVTIVGREREDWSR